MREAFILSACRTPIGKFQGALSKWSVGELGAVAVKGAIERAATDPAQVEEVILGHVIAAGSGQAPARQAALKAGLPPTVAAVSVNKVCGSGLKAVMLADQAIRCGDANVIVAGGMESMSRAGYVMPRAASPLGDRTLFDTLQLDGLTCAMSGRPMGHIADGLAVQAGISRADQDRYSLESHRRAIAAIEAGAFHDEIIPMKSQGRDAAVIDRDEGPRGDSTLEKLGSLRPVFNEQGTVTPGNASMISDGAAAVVVASSEMVRRTGAKPLAGIIASATAGGPPEELFTAPVNAIRNLMSKSGRSLSEIDLFELNEAFAVQMLACVRQLEIPLERMNVNGGAIALGHPIGASGARVLVTLIHALRRRGGKLGVAALCLGGGNAVAMLIERV
ncbi:acetyl-CoA acetyltransferase [Planctomyces sp. SCGC AG-212-M04]|nr:acetyl-CoA acetyltransferase [Planctomyces sp. SCGC AG-212-M04]